MSRVLLTTAYLAPISYYMQLCRASETVIEQHDNYLKQTYRNRSVIASANGLQTLSIPVIKPDSPKCLTRDIRISTHGDWQHRHWNAITSAYRSSPFFDYYEDAFRPFYEKKPLFLFDFNEDLRQLICRLLDIMPNISYSTEYIRQTDADMSDLREAIHPKKRENRSDFTEYYQVFSEKYGFQANLSIIDLLFNMGNESILVISV